MPDIVDAQTRSRLMAGIRGKDTKPELALRRALHRRGYRYRLHNPKLPGKPDIVFTSRRAVIMVHGCFWHAHNCDLFRWPSTRELFWRNKINRNRDRDSEVQRALEALGWRIMVVWECALKGRTRKPFDDVVGSITLWLDKGSANIEIRGKQTR